MDKFNNQFATHKLRQEADNSWPETITSRYQDEYLFIHDENKPGFYNVKDLATGKIVGRFGFKTPENAIEFAKDKIKPQGGRQSSGLGETSMTSAGATFTPGTGEQMATNKAFKKKPKTEEKDVEPKLAAGKAKVYMKDKWGWKDAPSVPNRPSKGGFIYKQLFEELSDFVKENQIKEEVKYTITDSYRYIMYMRNLGTEIQKFKDRNQLIDLQKKLDGQPDLIAKLATLDSMEEIVGKDSTVDNATKKNALKYIETIRNLHQPEEQGDGEGTYDWFINKNLKENYSKFKTETKTRGKSDQFHQAVREVRKKVLEINRLFEYVSRLKSELSEGEGGLKYKIHTEKALAKIKEMVSELNQNIKKFK